MTLENHHPGLRKNKSFPSVATSEKVTCSCCFFTCTAADTEEVLDSLDFDVDFSLDLILEAAKFKTILAET